MACGSSLLVTRMTAAAAPLSRGFDPEWPHGHEACIDGEFFPARILCTNLKFNRPVLAAILRDGEETCRAYRTDGTWYEDERRHENFYLRNAPAPRASGTDWVVRWDTVGLLNPKMLWSNVSRYTNKAEASAAAEALCRSPNCKNVAVVQYGWTEFDLSDGLEPQP